MKEQDRLRKLFDQARSEKPVLKEDQIDVLVKSGKKVSADKIRLGKPGRGLFNPLNLIIMISTIAIITSLVIIFSGNRAEKQRNNVPDPHIYEYSTEHKNDVDPKENKSQTSELGIKKKKNNREDTKIVSPGVSKPDPIEEKVAKDTVIRGEILHLNKEELKRLGFEFDEYGYYYLNELPDGSKINLWSYHKDGQGGSLGFGRGAYVNPAIKKQPTRRDYYPVCNSSLFGDQLRTMQGLPDDFADRFAYYNDTLIPVMLLWNELGGKPEKELLAWFKVSEQFFKDLNYSKDEYYEYMRTKEIVAANPKFNLVEYDYSYNDLNIYNSIMVNSSLLDNFGFHLTADSLVYRHGSFETAVEFWFTDFGRGVQSISNMVLNNQGDEIDKPLLCAISSLRMQMTMNVNPKAYYDIDSTINGSNWIDICIPVEFTDSKGKLWEGSTFWFYPNESLFRNLPDSIGDPMRREYNSNVAPKLRGTELEGSLYVIGPGIRMPDSIINKKSVEETVPCEYFPSFCEGLPGVDDLNVYPNPVVDILNLEITVSRKKDIDFRIFDISGRLMIDEMETKNCPDAGMYRHQIDVSSLEKGFYLLVLTDEEGAKMTRRVIRQ